jgi:hypothetical protein
VLYIDDKLPTHPKILKAGSRLGENGPAHALALFLAGLAYAREQLTDGFIPDQFVVGCPLVRRPLDVARVLADRRVSLWHKVRGGYLIHDYHDWNDKAQVLKDKRQKAREKKARQRAAAAAASPPVSPILSPQDNRGTSRAVGVQRVDLDSGDPGKEGLGEKGSADRELDARADAFCMRYAVIFERVRGVAYVPQGDPDREAARALVAIYPDTRLDVLAEGFLVAKDPYCRNGSGSISHFRSRAMWCDGRLTRHGL